MAKVLPQHIEGVPYNTAEVIDIDTGCNRFKMETELEAFKHDNTRDNLTIIFRFVDCNSYLGAIPWWEPLEQHRQTLAVG